MDYQLWLNAAGYKLSGVGVSGKHILPIIKTGRQGDNSWIFYSVSYKIKKVALLSAKNNQNCLVLQHKVNLSWEQKGCLPKNVGYLVYTQTKAMFVSALD